MEKRAYDELSRCNRGVVPRFHSPMPRTTAPGGSAIGGPFERYQPAIRNLHDKAPLPLPL
jgi:hypothetical protein